MYNIVLFSGNFLKCYLLTTVFTVFHDQLCSLFMFFLFHYWLDWLVLRQNESATGIFFTSNETFLMDCYCNNIVTFDFPSVIFLAKRCFDLTQNCNLRIRSGAGEGKGQHYEGYVRFSEGQGVRRYQGILEFDLVSVFHFIKTKQQAPELDNAVKVLHCVNECWFLYDALKIVQP